MSILSQIIAYAPNKIDTETKARSLVQELRPMAQGGRIPFGEAGFVVSNNTQKSKLKFTKKQDDLAEKVYDKSMKELYKTDRNKFYDIRYNKVKENINEEITKSQLDAIEVYADKLFAKLGIDIEFTKHFLDRVNDKRNIKPISVPELVGMFNQLGREDLTNNAKDNFKANEK